MSTCVWVALLEVDVGVQFAHVLVESVKLVIEIFIQLPCANLLCTAVNDQPSEHLASLLGLLISSLPLIRFFRLAISANAYLRLQVAPRADLLKPRMALIIKHRTIYVHHVQRAIQSGLSFAIEDVDLAQFEP